MIEQLGDQEVHEAVVAIRREIDVLCAREARVLAEWHKRRIWANNGARTPASRLAFETGLSLKDANHLIHRARKLDSMPLCAAAFENGELSSSKVDLLVRANHSSVAEVFKRDEEMLLEKVKELRFRHAVKVVRYWLQLADDTNTEDKGKKQIEGRYAFLDTTFEGSRDLRALFEQVGGEIFEDELERLVKQLFEEDWAGAKAIYGDDVRADLLKRTPAQRRCDALVLMAKRSASATGAGATRPLVTVLVDYNTFGRVCELASGTVIAPGQVVPLLSEAHIERIVFDGGSRVIDVSRKRSFTGALRRALEIRDGHCQDPSECDEPATKCDGDHLKAYARGGRTEQSNGRLLCPKHNRRKGLGP